MITTLPRCDKFSQKFKVRPQKNVVTVRYTYTIYIMYTIHFSYIPTYVYINKNTVYWCQNIN